MNFHVVYLVVLGVACVFADAPAKKSAPEKVDRDPKPKREAPLVSGSGYHGPSYKYLPPSPAVSSSGYDSYSSGYHGLHSDVGAHDFGVSSSAGHPVRHFGFASPKVETYIVRTQSAHGDEHSPLSGTGYKYAGPSTSFRGGFSGHSNSLSGTFGHHGHAPVHKVKAIVIPTRGISAGSHGGSGYTRFGGSQGGFGYSKGLSGGSHYFSGSSNSHNVGGSYAGGSFGKHEGFASSYGGSQAVAIDALVSTGPHTFDNAGSDPLHSLEAAFREADHAGGHGGHGGQGGYSYEAPVSQHSHESHGVPSTVYGAPVGDLSPPYNVGESAGGHVNPSPSYAAGHKGLGHFGFAASRPQVLHTSYVDSSKYEDSFAGHGSHDISHIAEKAPFKPSLFLGATHESGPTGSGVSSEYGPPAPSHGVSSHYVPPPTSDGYDYPPPSALYGAPSHSQSGVDSTAPAHEPEPAYLPPSAHPQTSYLPPAAPGGSYLPPHH